MSLHVYDSFDALCKGHIFQQLHDEGLHAAGHQTVLTSAPPDTIHVLAAFGF